MLVLLVAVAVADPLEDGSASAGERPDFGLLLPDPHEGEEPPSAIINGQRERGYPSTLGLGLAGFTICTGSLIAPRVVLTAAHCSADFPIEVVVELAVAYVGTDAAEADAELAFSGGVAHPGYVPLVSGGTLGQNDVAVLFLEDDAPIDPVWFRTEPFRPRGTENEDVISVGFGLDENQSSNVKRSATLKVAELDPVFLISNSSGNENGANICSGDSGGPQYHVEEDGTLVQWAVHSWGDTACRAQSGSTRTDVVGEWILDQVEQEHGSRDRCVIFDQYDDGVCDVGCAGIDPDCVPSPALALVQAGGCSHTPSRAGMFGVLGWMGLVRTRRRSP